MAVKSAFTHTEFQHYVKATERSVMDQQPPTSFSGCQTSLVVYYRIILTIKSYKFW